MAKAKFKTKKTLFTTNLDLNLRKELVKCYILSTAYLALKHGHFRVSMTNNWKVLKCGAGEACRQSVGLIM